jgi:hypothetical protein
MPILALTLDNTPAPIGRFKRTCAECGDAFRSDKQHAEFCTLVCRRAFNNRRMVRGAELYDLFMCLRYERGIARALKVWKLLCRMAQGFREEDQRERAGRNSWQPARKVLERHTYLHATVISSTTWRRAG